MKLFLAYLVDPRPGLRFDLAALVAAFAEQFEARDFRGFDLEGFLRALVHEFYAAATRQDRLREVIEVRLLGEISFGVGAVAEHTGRTADATEQMARDIDEIKHVVRRLFESGTDEPLRERVRTRLERGWIDAFDGYGALVAALHAEGYDLGVDATGEAVEIVSGWSRPELPEASLAPLLDAAVELQAGRPRPRQARAGALLRAGLRQAPPRHEERPGSVKGSHPHSTRVRGWQRLARVRELAVHPDRS